MSRYRFDDWLAQPGLPKMLTLLALLSIPGLVAGAIYALVT